MNKRYFYAQLDSTGQVVAISDLKGPVDKPGMVALQSLADCEIGDIYQGGEFITPEPDESGL